jgi:hypothetical protein
LPVDDELSDEQTDLVGCYFALRTRPDVCLHLSFLRTNKDCFLLEI